MPDPTPEFSLSCNNTWPELVGTCLDGKRQPVSITGRTLTFVMFPFDGGEAVINNSTTGQIENLDDGTELNRGKFRYNWQTGDTDSIGFFRAYLKIDFGGGKLASFPRDGLVVRIWP